MLVKYLKTILEHGHEVTFRAAPDVPLPMIDVAIEAADRCYMVRLATEGPIPLADLLERVLWTFVVVQQKWPVNG